MSVTWVEVWTLKRGIIDPPEPVLPSVQVQLQRDYVAARFERDPPLTESEWWAEILSPGQYMRSRKRAS